MGVAIQRPYEAVYDFLANPRNLFSWASVLGAEYHAEAPLEWVAEKPAFIDRPVTIRFTARNPFGVLDVSASIDGRQVFAAPVRVVRDGEGSLVTMTIFAPADDSEAAFHSELEWVRTDLLTLKSLLGTA